MDQAAVEAYVEKQIRPQIEEDSSKQDQTKSHQIFYRKQLLHMMLRNYRKVTTLNAVYKSTKEPNVYIQETHRL